MKYGETLRQRSIPAWSHYNIDYDDIKLLIKERTTPGKGKNIAIPGRGDERLAAFEDELYNIFVDQHRRIGLFVRSKAGEIQRRLEHSEKQTTQLAKRQASDTANAAISMGFLQRLNRLETEILKAGDEIRLLIRFIAAQRTAFRKLLKKFKKWTGSSGLEDRLRYEITANPKSFTNFDSTSLMDKFSDAREAIRLIYEDRSLPPPRAQNLDGAESVQSFSFANKQLSDAAEGSSQLVFDVAMATAPLAESTVYATYFVHPEDLGELSVFLLEHLHFHTPRSRQSSTSASMSRSPQSETFRMVDNDKAADYCTVSLDRLTRFVEEQSSVTVGDRENLPGSTPQKTKVAIHWNLNEEAMACIRSTDGTIKTGTLKKKHVPGLFARSSDILAPQSKPSSDKDAGINLVRKELVRDPELEGLFEQSSRRTRFVGLGNGPSHLLLATLDSDIVFKQSGSGDNTHVSRFDFEVLVVREEGTARFSLTSLLDESHLVERVRGFSAEYHGVWSTHPRLKVAAPFWQPLFSNDIRKPPPMSLPKLSTSERASLARSTTSTGSLQDATGSNTAVETSNDQSVHEFPSPRKTKRKDKRRAYFDLPTNPEPQPKYWNEYDHPEDGDEDNDPFVLYIDPDEKSVFDRFFDSIGSLFSRQSHPSREEEPLLTSPTSPRDDESSSSEGDDTTRRKTTFGTFPRFITAGPSTAVDATRQHHARLFSLFAITCFSASTIILAVAYVLALTAKRKYVQTVDMSVVAAIICSMVFAVAGFISVLHQSTQRVYLNGVSWAISATLLLVDCIAAGCLLVWMFD